MSAIGLDVGTSRVKAVRFDEGWKAVDVEGEASAVLRGPSGASEQDMADVWDSARRVVATVASRCPDPVTLLAVTGQGDGCWLVDTGGRPVGPALLWNDNRAGDIIATWRSEGRLDEAFRRSGCMASSGIAHAELAWLQHHRPEVLDRAATLLSCSAWIYHQLTGRRVLEQSEAANPFFDARLREYDLGLLELFELTGLERLLPDVVRDGDRVAPLSATVAGDLGLPPDTPVAIAPYDVPATAIGTATTRVGQAFAVLGTTLCVGTVTDDPRLDRPPNGFVLPCSPDGRWLVAYATMIGTEVLDWTATLLGLPDAAAVTELAATATREDPPLVLPYFSRSGERSPFLDPDVRATVTDLDSRHLPADIARGAVDGLSLVVRDCLLAAGEAGELAVSGGGAASTTWLQTLADATGVPLHRPDAPEAGARGAVLSAATDLGRWSDLDAAVDSATATGTTIEPDPVQTDRLDRAYARFLDVRDTLRRLR